MIREHLPKGRITALLAVMAAIGIYATFAVGSSSGAQPTAPGRELLGEFCNVPNTNPVNHLCMGISADGGQTYYHGYDADHLTINPGTYWITVNDNNAFHNFELRGPFDSEADLFASVGTDGLGLSDGTGVPNELAFAGGNVTTKVLLKHGWYRLYCDAPNHESGGMWVDFEVGGKGQVG